MKKIGLIFILLCIGYFSNTPNLRVLEIHTWINQPLYEKGLTLKHLFQASSPFYFPYVGPFNLEFYMHKLGHLSAYFLATFAIVLSYPNLKLRYVMLMIMGFAFLDEIHQFFVVGRSGRLVDIALDCSSSFLFLLILKAKKIRLRLKTMKKNGFENVKRT